MTERNAFTFTSDEFEAIEAVLGRSDAPAHRFIADLELIGNACVQVRRDGFARTMPARVREDLQSFVTAAGAVSEPLYRLPADLQALLILSLISASTRERALTDLTAVMEPLADLAAVAQGLLDEASANRDGAPDLWIALVMAAARSYRNAFNIPVGRVERAGFRETLRVLLKALAARGVNEVAGLLVSLDEALEEVLTARSRSPEGARSVG